VGRGRVIFSGAINPLHHMSTSGSSYRSFRSSVTAAGVTDWLKGGAGAVTKNASYTTRSTLDNGEQAVCPALYVTQATLQQGNAI